MWPSGLRLRTILVVFEDYSHCVRARFASVGCRRYDFHSRCEGNKLSLRFSNVFPTFFEFPAIFFAPLSVTRYSVTVQKSTISVLKILLYLYINIELIFDFQNTCLRTVTLSHCNASTMRKNQREFFCRTDSTLTDFCAINHSGVFSD